MLSNFFFIALCFINVITSSLLAQDIPSDFPLNYVYNLKLDIGEGWSSKASGAITWQDLKLNENNRDSISFGYRIGSRIFINQNSISYNPYIYGRGTFFKNYYTYMYSRAIDNYSDNSYNGYSGKKLDRSRFGLVSAENDLAGFGYKNRWLKLQYGRGREILTKNTKIALVLSQDSPSYDYGLIGLRFKNLQTKYFHGFLENYENMNRYINGRIIDYNNGIFL